jgi:Tol biopolymer transport system component
MPFYITRLEPRGKALPVLHDVIYSPIFGSAQIDVSGSGTLIYRTGAPGIGHVTVQVIDNRGAQRPLLAQPGTYINPRLSPDGERLALFSREGEAATLSVYDRQRDIMTRLMQSEGFSLGGFANWTPDGRFIVLRGSGGMYWIRVNSAGEPRALTRTQYFQTPTSFSPDGKTLVYTESKVGSGSGSTDIWTVSVENDGSELRATDPRPFLQSAADEYNATFSSDGRWLAYTSAESGTYQVYVRSWPDSGRKWQISSSTGIYPLFARRGSELFFLNEDGRIMVASYRTTGDQFAPDRARVWSEKPIASLGAMIWSYDVMPNGEGIAALMLPEGPQQQRAQNHVVVLQNFFDHLKRIVPAK